MKIALISDTHGDLPTDITKHLADCDEIWHAGDIGTMNVLDKLRSIAPTVAVWGNIDGADIRSETKEVLIFEREGVKVLIMHIGGYPPKYNAKSREVLNNANPDLFVCGHSHILKVIRDPKRKLIHLNPGAAGYKGFHKFRTLLTFKLNDGDISDLQVIELGKRGSSKH
jgi:putative phosphoesterase